MWIHAVMLRQPCDSSAVARVSADFAGGAQLDDAGRCLRWPPDPYQIGNSKPGDASLCERRYDPSVRRERRAVLTPTRRARRPEGGSGRGRIWQQSRRVCPGAAVPAINIG